MTARRGELAEQGLGRWLEARKPCAPDTVLLRLGLVHATAGPADDLVEAVLAEARAALRDALDARGERDGAFRLLAADAYVTYACEAALESPDPGVALLRVLEGVVAEAEGG